MCDVIGKAMALEASMTRRGLLRNAGIATVATAAGGRLLTGEAAAARGRGNGAPPRGGGGGARRHRTRLVLLGTAGGPWCCPARRIGTVSPPRSW